jgi:hypothetical protein
MESNPELKVTFPYIADDNLINEAMKASGNE